MTENNWDAAKDGVQNINFLTTLIHCHVKGALENLSIIPNFVYLQSSDFHILEVCTYVETACLILLAASTL